MILVELELWSRALTIILAAVAAQAVVGILLVLTFCREE
jgi:hypothetical protein